VPSKQHVRRQIPEHPKRPGMRLGRHLHHDPKSVNYPMADMLDRSVPLANNRWRRMLPALDQGSVGSCTGNGMLGHLATHPLHMPSGWRGLHYNEVTARDVLYSRATEIDEWEGQYPPDDTGSSGLAVCKAAQEKGWIDNYVWGFTLDDTLRWLSQKGTVIVGTIWTEDMFTPDAQGFLHPTGADAGGHEYELLAIEITDATPGQEQGWVEMENSWTPRWGQRGRAKITFPNLKSLLIDQQGDAKAGIRNAA
jgi:hypothetical protein